MLTEVMDIIYTWVDSIINNPADPNNPNLTILPSHSDVPAPSSTYLTLVYAPALTTIGKSDWEVQEDSGLYYNVLRTDYEGTVEIWESKGIGEYLTKLVNFQWIEEVNCILRENYISVLRNGDIITIPTLQPEKRWEHESMVEFTFAFGAGLRYEIDTVEHIEVTGTLVEEDGTERIVEIEADAP